MTDQYESNVLTRPEPALRIAAVYPASDGRAPESIDVEVSQDADPQAVAPLIELVVSALARVAQLRDVPRTFARGGYISGSGGGSITTQAIDETSGGAIGGSSRVLYDADNPDGSVAGVRTDDERRAGAGVAR